MRKLIPKLNEVIAPCFSQREYLEKAREVNPGVKMVYMPHQGRKECARRARQIAAKANNGI
jgi:hypothetical protein